MVIISLIVHLPDPGLSTFRKIQVKNNWKSKFRNSRWSREELHTMLSVNTIELMVSLTCYKHFSGTPWSKEGQKISWLQVSEQICISDNQLIPLPDKTRGHSQRFRQIATRTNYRKHSFFPSFIPHWNSLPKSPVESRTISGWDLKILTWIFTDSV